MKRFIITLFVGGVLVAIASAFWIFTQYQAFLTKPVQVTGEETVFAIARGSHIRRVARELSRQKIFPDEDLLIDPKWLFIAHARLQDQAASIKAGQYAIEKGMLPAELLQRFVDGKTIQYQISFIEGRSFKDIIASVRSHPKLKKTLSEADYSDHDRLMVKLGAPEGTYPEGWFFPDTYYFPHGSTDFEVLKRAYDTMRDYLASAWDKHKEAVAAELDSPYQALTLASIVEKETGAPEERPLIAGVFLNRLKKGMLLQTDPTVIYGMGDKYQGNIRKKDLRKDTPYNTYTRKGLPPTPIATPGKAAIDAVFNPEATDKFYFVATGLGDGRHFFSKTYKEHRKAVIKYQLNGKSSRYQGDK